MSGDVCPAERQQAKARSAVSNGKTMLLFGDARGRGARRFRDLVAAFGNEAGGYENLAPSAQQIVRALAETSVQLELMQAAQADGAAIDAETFVRLVGTQRRLLRDLARLRPKPTSEPGAALRQHLATRYGTPQPVSDAA